MNYPWYDYAETSQDVDFFEILEQGDIFFNLPVFKVNIKPSSTKVQIEKNQIGIRKKRITAIVLTQSCDLENDKVNEVVLAPVYKLSSVLKGFYTKYHDQVKKDIHEGFIFRLHLLNVIESSEFQNDHPVVDFEKLYLVPKHYLYLYISHKQVRLLSPYKEHLSQGFARFYMRVGIPTPISSLV